MIDRFVEPDRIARESVVLNQRVKLFKELSRLHISPAIPEADGDLLLARLKEELFESQRRVRQ